MGGNCWSNPQDRCSQISEREVVVFFFSHKGLLFPKNIKHKQYKHFSEKRQRPTVTCKRRGEGVKTRSSWFSCASFGCCEISLLSSSRAPRGHGGSCSARSLSWFSLCRTRGTSIRAGCSSRTGRKTPPRKKQSVPYLSPFGDGVLQSSPDESRNK